MPDSQQVFILFSVRHATRDETYNKDVITIVCIGQNTSDTIHVEPAGTLSELAGDPEAIVNLTLTGYLNGTDIKFIRSLKNLQRLDISGARIVEGGDKYYQNYLTANDITGDYMFFIAFTDNTHCTVTMNIIIVKTCHFRHTESAIEEESQNTIITLFVISVNSIKKLNALFKSKILWQGFFIFWRFKLFHGICIKQMFIICYVLKKAFQTGTFSCTGRTLIVAVTIKKIHIIICKFKINGFN